MEHKILRRAIAVTALVFMGVFSVTFVITLIDPKLCGGAFGYAALVSGLLGAGLYLVLRFGMKAEGETDRSPDDGTDNDDAHDGGEDTRLEETAIRKDIDDTHDESGKKD